MGGGVHRLAEAVDQAAAVEQPRLQALDVVDPAEHLILHLRIVARVEGGIADHRHALRGGGVGLGRVEGQPAALLQPLGLQQREIPVGVDHADAADGKGRAFGRAAMFAGEVDAGPHPVDEAQALCADPCGEQLRDVAVGHHQIGPHQKAGAAIGDRGVAEDLDPPDLGDRRLEPRMGRAAAHVIGPGLVLDAEIVPRHQHRRPQVGDDDRLGDVFLARVERVGGQHLVRHRGHLVAREAGRDAGGDQFLDRRADCLDRRAAPVEPRAFGEGGAARCRRGEQVAGETGGGQRLVHDLGVLVCEARAGRCGSCQEA